MFKLPFASGLLALLLALPASAQEIYRVVDEDGNVTYTDQKPSDDAEPMELPDLNVLEGEEGEAALAGGDTSAPSMNFRIERPADNAVITTGSEQLDVVMGIAIDVPPTARIVLVLDGRELAAVRSLEAVIPTPPPGEHRLFARLETPSGRVLATTNPVTFTTVAPAGG